jgi:hypothetical protein
MNLSIIKIALRSAGKRGRKTKTKNQGIGGKIEGKGIIISGSPPKKGFLF